MPKPKHRQLYPQIAKSWSGPLMGWTQQASKVIGFGLWKLTLLPLSPPSLSIPFPCPFSGGLGQSFYYFITAMLYMAPCLFVRRKWKSYQNG